MLPYRVISELMACVATGGRGNKNTKQVQKWINQVPGQHVGNWTMK